MATETSNTFRSKYLSNNKREKALPPVVVEVTCNIFIFPHLLIPLSLTLALQEFLTFASR